MAENKIKNIKGIINLLKEEVQKFENPTATINL